MYDLINGGHFKNLNICHVGCLFVGNGAKETKFIENMFL